MKKLILLFTLAPCIALGQLTYVPDNNFENYLESNSMGDGISNNDSVLTANISSVISLYVGFENISDLTGIEDFAALTDLWCEYNQLTSLNLSNNTALTYLVCNGNPLTSLDVSGATALTTLHCSNNQLTSLDVSNNTALTELNCGWNQLTSLDASGATALTSLSCLENQLASLDVSGATALTFLECQYNQLTSLDVSNNTALGNLYCLGNQLTCLNVKNGNNTNMGINANINPNLTCIEVDNSTWATANWTAIDPQTFFSEFCNNNCSSIPNVEICLITVDSTSTRNQVIWEKPITTAIDSFKIYRDVVGYTHIGSVSYSDLSTYIDTAQGINPNTTSYRYKLSAIDTSGNEGMLGDYHKTIHLQISQGIPPALNLAWNDYIGFSYTYYRILRDDNGTGNWQVMDSVSSGITSYTDAAPPSPNSRYIVVVVHPSGCTISKKATLIATSRSNIAETGQGTGINELPAPNKELLLITDILGRTTHPVPKTLLFYIYDDGSVEKRIQLER